MVASEPQLLGPYQLVEPIATGTTATVWRARDTRSREDVVIKRFHPHIVADDTGRRRIAAEADHARRLTHPAIVRPIDQIATDDELALVFPHVAGTSLAALLHEGKALPAERAAAIGADVADALAAAHAAGIVHRDVKPGNILVAEDGGARLLDFGIARSTAGQAAADRGLTGDGLVLGTLPYMAPEQLRGEPTGPATDVFALGVVLYEMLAGQRPFNASTPVALLAEQALPPTHIASAPPGLADLVTALLAPDPMARPTAQQLAASLRAGDTGWGAADAPTVAVAAPVLAPANSQPNPPRRRAYAPAFLALAVMALLALAATLALSGGAAISVAPLPSGGSEVVQADVDGTNGTVDASADQPAVDRPAATEEPRDAGRGDGNDARDRGRRDGNEAGDRGKSKGGPGERKQDRDDKDD